MFVTLSKTIGRVGGFRIGVGKRITSKNAWWMCLIVCFVAIFQLMWYALVLAFWLTYAMFYGMWWCCKKIVLGIAHAIGKGKRAATNISSHDRAVEQLQANTYANATVNQPPVYEELNNVPTSEHRD